MSAQCYARGTLLSCFITESYNYYVNLMICAGWSAAARVEGAVIRSQ